MKHILALLLLCCITCSVYAQGVAINSSGAPADTSAMLDVSSVTKGMLIPRMTQAQRKAIHLPATGLIVFQTDSLHGLYINTGNPGDPEWVVFSANNLTSNTAVGFAALEANGAGGSNTAIGYQALQSNTIGSENTAIGVQILQNNTTGILNVASGNYALGQNTTGSYNSGYGHSALYGNETGSYNTAVGTYAMDGSGASSDANTAVGYSALEGIDGGSRNTAIGINALGSNSAGNDNTASGANALGGTTTGHGNTAIGVGALSTNTDGVENAAIGYHSLNLNDGGYNTASGSYALQSSTNAYFSTATGFSALSANTTGNYNTAAGSYALGVNVTGEKLTAIGYHADVSTDGLTNATAIGNGAIVNASNKIRLGDNFVTVIEGRVAYTFTSDSTKKENHRKVDGEVTLEKIKSMNIGSWNYKEQNPGEFRHYGPMAQEFFSAFGHDGFGTVGTDTTICSGDLDGISLIAIQQLIKDSQNMKAELSALKSENVYLRKLSSEVNNRLTRIEQALDHHSASSSVDQTLVNK